MHYLFNIFSSRGKQRFKKIQLDRKKVFLLLFVLVRHKKHLCIEYKKYKEAVDRNINMTSHIFLCKQIDAFKKRFKRFLTISSAYYNMKNNNPYRSVSASRPL